MREIRNIRPVNAHGLVGRANTGHRIAGATLHLGSSHRAINGIDGDDISEGSADINADFPTSVQGDQRAPGPKFHCA